MFIIGSTAAQQYLPVCFEVLVVFIWIVCLVGLCHLCVFRYTWDLIGHRRSNSEYQCTLQLF